VARATPSAAGNPSPQADRFDVILFGANSSNKKILQIKVTREVLGYGLKEAKDLVEALPQTVVRRVDAATARRIAAALEGAHGLSARTVPSSKSA
jgi:large subunit ribosomal protein L7/L12